MQGFFSKKETQTVDAVGGKIHSCASCGLYRGCSSPKMKPQGDFEKGIMLIGEAPKHAEDESGELWRSAEGNLLNRALRSLGIDIFRDCMSMNSVNCMPTTKGEYRAPTSQEIDHCRSVIVWKALKKYKPKVIIPLGSNALASVIGHRWNGTSSVYRWHGFTIPDQTLDAWVCPTYKPEYILQNKSEKDLLDIWERELDQAIGMVDKPFLKHTEPEIEIVDDLSFLNDVPRDVLSVFDYETTGIKPQGKDHKIVAGSIATSENHAWAFGMPKTAKERMPLRRWLHDRNVPKSAHNIKFEDSWSNVILKVDVNGWRWDSMLAAHLIDNRRGITGLKFQVYANFGIEDYSSEVSPYLKSIGEGANAPNRIVELMRSARGRKKVLKYCGLDSVYGLRLTNQQMNKCGFT